MKNHLQMNLKRIGVFAVLLLAVVGASASLHFDRKAKYRIECNHVAGGIGVGSVHNQSTPVFYVVDGKSEDDLLWYILEVSEGKYLLKNAKTGEYMTYDGIREGQDRRYLTVTKEVRGDSSLWTFDKYDDSYTVSCVLDVEQPSFNLRTSSNVVGTYGHSTSQNSLFKFYDESDNLYTPQDVVPSFDYGTTRDGYYWENTAIDMPVVFTENLNDPVYYVIKNVRSGKYVKVDPDDKCLSQVDDEPTEFYFVEGTTGVNIYTKENMYLSGHITGTSQKNIAAVDGVTSKSDHLWGFDHFDADNPGYGVHVVYASENGNDNQWFNAGSTYWNDYYQNFLCYFAEDGGSTFVFYSKDVRHKDYLAQHGIILFEPDTTVSYSNFREALDTLLINGKTLVYDNLYGTYMQTAPSDLRGGEPYQTEVHYTARDNNFLPDLYINGTLVKDGDEYTFTKLGNNESYDLELKQGDKVLATDKLTFTFLPIVEINGTSLSTSYHRGSIRVNDINTIAPVDTLYNANLRHRGATAAGKRKKSYAIKLKDANWQSIDRKFLNMREDNNWILDAMAVDPGRMRNRVSTDLWLDFSTPPYQSKYEKKAVNGTHGQFVEVLLNGNYAGVYCLTEKVDRKQLKLKKIHPAQIETHQDTVRGTLYKSSSWTYSIFLGHNSDSRYYPMTKASNYSNYSMTWDGWENKYPDLDDGESIDWKPLYDAVNICAASNNNDFIFNVGAYYDLPVFMDYYLFLELILATDNHGKNMYLYNYDQTQFKKISLTPWDLDGVFGRRWNGSMNITSNPATDWITFIWSYEHGEYTIYKRLKELDYENWNQRVAARYQALRDSKIFNAGNLLKRFTDYRDLLKESGAEDREIKRWQGADVYMDFDYEMDYLKTWIEGRIKYLDKQYNYSEPVDPYDGIKDTKYLGATGGKGCIYFHVIEPIVVNVYTVSGVKVTSQEVSGNISKIDGLQPGIYVVNGKKIVVR